ncbi:ParB/RepB/Spo0J family partition protein [Hydrogenophaga sp. 2FB]|uniref:ParB/RepB/Spo0J family partition protein n=1 Tax=Hydrogenophaga sp. 2FB TaxID=2502187 RepID=UPI0010F63AEA|nr:ParB/RepB/Spo0J family partition protein [Hydrogenophaga sp. 2FB]
MAIVKKLKLDTKAAMATHQTAASKAAVDRFALAEQITKVQPTGLAPVASDADVAATPAPTPVALATRQLAVSTAQPFDLSVCIPGNIVEVPLNLIDPNPLSPRHIYTTEEVDKIARTMPNGQDVAAHGYLLDGRVKLYDGGTRFRAAKITDRTTLAVKIEEPPADKLALFKRARELNEQRSDTTALDFALSLRALLNEGAVSSQRELMEKVEAPGGGKLSESLVSTYMRISRMPDKVQRAMSDSPDTSSVVALYAVSELFPESLSDAELETNQEMAFEIIDEIKRRKLNRFQIAALVKSKIAGPKARERSTVHPLEFGKHKGQIKMFSKKGQIDLSLKGLSDVEMPALRAALVQTLESFMKDKGEESK